MHCVDCREDGSTHGVLLCPPHAAALELLKVLNNFAAYTYSDLCEDPAIWQEFLADARAAITKAKP
jgi:hypothetical protein